MHRSAKTGLLAVAILLLPGCAVGYYWQAVGGHLDLMRAREPVAEVLADPATPPEVAAMLRAAGEALDFAHAELGLPDRGSYRHYARTGRPYLVYNVFAAPPLSLDPREWCFPVAGCVTYRGYFDAEAAREKARRQQAAGDDVFVGGAIAYSTLGRFDDPLLDTMVPLPPYRVAGLLFHELAHQRLYVPDAAGFNEAFATVVEQAGTLAWLEARGDAAGLADYCRFLARRDQAQAILDALRARLATLYATEARPAVALQEKALALFEARDAYRALRTEWGGPPWFDGWFEPGLNNASLGALATYDARVPAFRALLARSGGSVPAFLDAVEALAALDPAAREAALDALQAGRVSVGPSGDSCRSAAAGR